MKATDLPLIQAEAIKELAVRIRQAQAYLDWTEEEFHLEVSTVRDRLRSILKGVES